MNYADRVRYVSTHKFTHRDSVTGEMLEWEQEDEASVTTKDQAVAMIQRTISFMLPKLRDELVAQKGLTIEQATEKARSSMRAVLEGQLWQQKSLAGWFKLAVSDFKFK